MSSVKIQRKPLFIFTLFVLIACTPRMTRHSSELIAKGDVAVLDNSRTTLDSGSLESRSVKKIWPEKEPAVITAVGDVALNFATMKEIIDYRISKYGRKEAMAYPFSKVKKELKGVAFCNLESPITNHDLKPFNDKDEIFYFTSPGGSEEILKYAGFKVASLANNHVKDAGVEGMFETSQLLEKIKISPVGIGKNITDALKPVFIWHRGTRVAIFAFNNVVPKSVWAGPDRAGTAGGSDELLCAAVKKVRGEVDAVVVSIHWGQEVVSDYPVNPPEKEQVALGHKLIDSGASCIIGHQSHGLGPVERYKNGIIFYSLGDFVFAGRHSAAHRTSMMIRVSLSKEGLESYTLIPVNINPLEVKYSPEILSKKNGAAVIDRVLKVKDDKYADYYTKDKSEVQVAK